MLLDTSGLYLSVLTNNTLTTWKYAEEELLLVPDSTGIQAAASNWKLEHKLTGIPLQDFVVLMSVANNVTGDTITYTW